MPPIIELTQGEGSQKYNIQLDFMKHHMSGMLIVRRMPDNEIRIVASTYFGLSLFDFSLRNDQFTVNSCIEPMKKEKVLKLLEMDFRRLFLSGKDTRVKATKDSATEKRTRGTVERQRSHFQLLTVQTDKAGILASILTVCNQSNSFRRGDFIQTVVHQV